MSDKEQVINLIKEAYDQLNAHILTTEGYEIVLGAICTEYGTEFVAEAFVEMTKTGVLA